MLRVIKVFAKFFFLLALVFIGAHYVLLQGNYNKFKPQIQQYFQKNYKFNCKINGDIKFILLPSPALQIKDVILQDSPNYLFINLPKTNISVNPLVIFHKNINYFHNISADAASIKLKDSSNLGKQVLTQLLKDRILINPGLKLSFKNTKFALLDKKTNVLNYELSNLDIELSYVDKNLELQVNADNDQQRVHILASGVDEMLKPNKVNFNFQNQMFVLSADLSIDKSKKEYSLQGVSKIKLLKNNTKNIPAKNDIYNIVTDIDLDNNKMVVKNINAKDSFISGVNGEVSIDFDRASVISNLHINSFNIDQYLNEFSRRPIDRKNNLAYLKKLFFEEYSLRFLSYIRNSFYLKIGTMVLHEKEISDFKLDLKLWSLHSGNTRIVSLNDLSMNLPGEAKLQVQGILDSNKGSFFNGDMLFYGKHAADFARWFYQNKKLMPNYNGPFIAKSDFIHMPYVLHFNNFELATEKIHSLADFVLFDYNNYDYFFDGNVKLSKYHSDMPIIHEDLNKFIYSLFVADFDASGKTFDKNTDNFNIIRQHKGYSNLYLEAKNIMFQDLKLDAAMINFYLQKDKLFIKQLATHGDNNFFNGDIKVTTNSFLPKYDVDLYVKKIDEEIWQRSTGLLAGFRKKYSEQNKHLNADVINSLNFLGLNNIAGNFKIDVDQFDCLGVKLNNISFSGESSFGNIKLNAFTADSLDGKIRANANITTIRPVYSIQMGLGLDNVNIGKIADYFVANEDSGYLSASGYLEARGNNFSKMIENLDGEFHLEGKAIDYYGFDLDKFVEITNSTLSYDDKMSDIKYYSKYGDTFFENLSGKISINQGIAKAQNIVVNNKLINGLVSFAYSIPTKKYKTVANFIFSPTKNTTVTLVLNADEKNSVMDVTDLQKYLSEKQ